MHQRLVPCFPRAGPSTRLMGEAGGGGSWGVGEGGQGRGREMGKNSFLICEG